MISHALSVPLGVVVARERAGNPWQEFHWRPVSVFVDSAAAVGSPWREVERGRGFIHYHAVTMPLLLKGNQKVAYRVNLANGVPSVYVVLREAGTSGPTMPVSVAHVTASPFEIQSYGDKGQEIVGRVPMPEPLVQLLHSFVDDRLASTPGAERTSFWPAGLADGAKFGA